MRKIGIMGGTFNPIHIGHLLLAESALAEYALDEVWFMPTGCSYMKREDNILSGEIRYHMVELATQGNRQFKVSDMEIKRDGYTYTYETLRDLKQIYPEHDFYFIFGADCLYTIEKWKSPQEIFDHCTIVAALRGDSSLEDMKAKKRDLENLFHAKILLLPFMQVEISSTLIRDRITNGKSVRYMLPEKVLSFIEEKQLYSNHKRDNL